MRAVVLDDIEPIRINSGHDLLESVEFVLMPTSAHSLVIPGRMPVVAEYQFSANARAFSAGPRRLDVTKISQKVHQSRQTFCECCILRPLLLQAEHIQDLAPYRHQPAQGIRQRKGHTLARALV